MFPEEIVDAQLLDDSDIECKSKLDRNNVIGWLKTFTGFANANGGTLYVGVEDKTGKLIGFDRGDADSGRDYFNNQVNEHISPRPPYTISFVRKERKKNISFKSGRIDQQSNLLFSSLTVSRAVSSHETGRFYLRSDLCRDYLHEHP